MNYIMHVKKMICSEKKKIEVMTEEIAKAVNLSPGLMHNKGTGQGSPFVVHTPWTVKDAYFYRKYPNRRVLLNKTCSCLRLYWQY